MNIEQAKKASEIILNAGLVPFWWGPPGIGKTTGARQIAEKYKVDFLAVSTDTLMLEDLVGIGFNPSGSNKMIFSRPEIIPETGKGIMLIDELTDGMQSIQKNLRTLILEHRIKNHKLSPDYKIICAGNRPSDLSGSCMPPSSFLTRVIHLGICCDVPDFTRNLPETADVDINSWIEYFALPAKINPFIIAFLKSFPHRIYYYQSIPRTFEMLSKVLSVYNNPDPILHEIIIGTIGPETGNEFFGFYKLAQQIPSIDAILQYPDTAPIPQDIGIMHALTTALVYRADRLNFGNIVKYSQRLGHREMEVYLLTSAIKKDKDLSSIPEYLQWHNKNADILN